MFRRRLTPVLSFIVAINCFISRTIAVEPGISTISDDWPCWRGPNCDGISAGPPVPIQWSESSNIVWKTKIPGAGYSSPIVHGGRVYFQTANESNLTQSVICLDRHNGQEIWNVELHRGNFETANQGNSHATSTLACDGEHIYALFLNDRRIWATSLDLQGQRAWQKDVGEFNSRFGFSTSPSLYKSNCLIAADHQNGGFIAALNCKSGDLVWKVDRPRRTSHSSPRVIWFGGRDQLVIPGCKQFCSYDPMTGDELWKVDCNASAFVGTAVTSDELVFASGGSSGQHTLAVNANGKILWENKVNSYIPSLISVASHVYIISDEGVIRCFAAKTGKETWKKRIGEAFYASPVVNHDRIFVTSRSGLTTVLNADPNKFETIANNQLGDEAYASPAISQGQIFFRIADNSKGPRQEWIYCIGQVGESKSFND